MPRDIEKPRKTLRRGIHITEHKDYRINPEPLILREADFLLEEFLSPTKLVCTDDLQKITELEMIVDTSDTSLGNFGIYLQNMIQLKLNNSVIPRVRDLGTSLSHIRILWMARCCLNDLDGVTSLQSLEELYIAYNEIIELSALSMLENLKILDLESNIVDDLRQVEFLALCPKLRSLSLEGNPVCSEPQPDLEQENYDYRAEILKRLPKIEILDDEKTTKDARRTKELKRTDSSLLFQQDWSLIEECIASGMAPPDDKLICNQIESRPRSSNSPLSRPTSAYYRPRSASLARPGSASGFRPGSAARFDHLAVNRPNTDPIMLESMDKVDDAVSELTIGPAFQGNLSKILRARKNQQQQQQTNQEAANEIKDEVTSDCVISIL
ncbi:unnamed protein product [Didymodactylos carnosus]|uniref:Leucine-rich repeat-containing protein 56 n=1 Tax=Didymodactylos carnosus TaxID=1234261 RepID=A0A814JB50_9BILA|nr:unnamed protein product [Didymodactylos carnosus]CAF1036959.1 unnamed protein product [Didymodactylos carnosus]CAF3574771.1 unnamed protein product [Didymodactylos carnosus]CAF3807451.1 unnamed protein product [Didymodactylos carnosus]